MGGPKGEARITAFSFEQDKGAFATCWIICLVLSTSSTEEWWPAQEEPGEKYRYIMYDDGFDFSKCWQNSQIG